MELSDLVATSQEAFSHPGIRYGCYLGINGVIAGCCYLGKKVPQEIRAVGAIALATILVFPEIPFTKNTYFFNNLFLHVGAFHLSGIGLQLLSYANYPDTNTLENMQKKEHTKE